MPMNDEFQDWNVLTLDSKLNELDKMLSIDLSKLTMTMLKEIYSSMTMVQ